MIFIYRDTATDVVCSLSQSATITQPYYLLKVTSNFNESFTPIYEELTLEVETERYDKFTLNFDIPKGEYTYVIYECEDPNPTDETDATGIVDEGLLIVDSSSDVDTDVYL